MTIYDDPNREAVGMAPIWTGAGEAPPPEGDTQADDEDDEAPKAKTTKKG